MMDNAVHPTPISIAIRPITHDELRLVAHHLPFDQTGAGRHREHFEMQRAGEALCLIAWHDSLPVGHALLRWRRQAKDTPLPACPHVSALLVHPEYRSRGIGSALLTSLEAIVRKRGYRRMGLNVGVLNVRARALYERLGYRDACFPPRHRSWRYVDAEGITRCAEETSTYLIKPL